jgi:2-polyprenyl-6-methoxyphenol hydroxylase-like FAD-dependent oxidoreductase
VLVVGAGPAGTAFALLLARAGVPVQLVESQRQHQRLLRGDGLMPSGLEALQRMGLAPLLANLPQRQLAGWSFYLKGQPLFSVAEPMGSPAPCTLIDTAALLNGMLEQALACPSFSFLPGKAVDRLLIEPETAAPPPPAGPVGDSQAGDSRVKGVVLEDGSELSADLVVACDGRGSRLRRQAQLERQEEATGLEVLWFELDAAAAALLQPWLAQRFVTLIGEESSYALFGTAQGGVRVGWLQQRGGEGGEQGGSEGSEEGDGPSAATPWPERWARSSPPALAALWRSLPAASLRPPLRFAIRPGLAPGWERPGLLLLGDGAHPMSPLRAQGLNMALRDALVAAEQLLPLLVPPAAASAASTSSSSNANANANASANGDRPAPDQQLHQLDAALVAVRRLRLPEISKVQALQRQELSRAELLRRLPILRRLLAATARWSGPLLARRWLAGQPTLRSGLPLPKRPA